MMSGEQESVVTFNNTAMILRDDLEKKITPHSVLSVMTAYFSIYAYHELKKQLDGIDNFRFIFTSPTFVTEKNEKAQREFYIPRLTREQGVLGTQFEVRLRNELTQKAIARDCADWIRKKAQFKSIRTHESVSEFMNLQATEHSFTYLPLKGFTTDEFGCGGNPSIYSMITRFSSPNNLQFTQLFEQIWRNESHLQDVTEEVIENISAVYRENSPELIYYMSLYNVFNEFLEDLSEDVLPNEKTGYQDSVIWKKLYSFQRDAAFAIINKLEQYNGCILADSVGLGKTFTALAVIKYYESRNKNVLVLCPKKLKDNWMTFRGNLINNPLVNDRLRYDILYHTDLSRNCGDTVMGLPIEQINWGNYDLVVIDESHNFRNGGITTDEFTDKYSEKENRYTRLMNRVIRMGVKTKVLMLSATPVNNRFLDLRNQLALAYEGHSEEINKKLKTKTDIDSIFRQAQRVYNAWTKLDAKDRTTEALLKQLDFDFFELLDSVTIARSRKHIQHYYDMSEIGSFPRRNKPVSLYPKLTDKPNAINYQEVYAQLVKLNLSIYTPSEYILAGKREKYIDPNSRQAQTISQSGRERGIQRLMNINLLKRMESSVHSFKLTVTRICKAYRETVRQIDLFQRNVSTTSKNGSISVQDITSPSDFDLDDQNIDLFSVGNKFKIDLCDMDYVSWRHDLQADLDILELLLLMISDITPQYDFKLNQLISIVCDKIEHPINEGNKKVLIFTAFTDTAEYLYDNLSACIKRRYGLNTALVTGSIDGRVTIPGFSGKINHVLTCFSPIAKDKTLSMPEDNNVIDILIATDCVSEGQNLQDCDYCINYDIHWNPVRIIQRFGRIDRIGSRNAVIQLVNFWPDLTLDEYINLKERVEARMRISVLTSTGDDDYINQNESGDLVYRRVQLEKLQNEVVDLEEMTSGISIMDLGLNEFRMDLIAYMKNHPGLEQTPFGINAVVPGEKPGVIFILKNINQDVNIENLNRLHPFYMVYIGDDDEVVYNHLDPKASLDCMRFLCRTKSEPDLSICHVFNKETKDGKDMRRISKMLRETVASIIDVKEERDIDSFFGSGQTTFLSGNIRGLNDFVLICFLVVVNK